VSDLTRRVYASVRTARDRETDCPADAEQPIEFARDYAGDRTTTRLRRPPREVGAVVADVKTQAYP